MTRKSSRWKGTSAAACALTTAATGIFASPQPAAAAGTVGLWLHKNLAGDVVYLTGDSDFSNNYFPSGPSLNDNVSSIQNMSDHLWCFYQHANYQGELLARIGAGETRWYVGDYANDRISSMRICYQD